MAWLGALLILGGFALIAWAHRRTRDWHKGFWDQKLLLTLAATLLASGFVALMLEAVQ
jgi:hypothetical protein